MGHPKRTASANASDVRESISVLSALLTLGLAVAAFSESKSAIRAWNTATLSALFAGATILVIEPNAFADVAIYASGLLFFGVLGLQSLLFMADKKSGLDLGVYSGMSVENPGGSVVLFVAVLGVSGFPISPTYLGQDLILHHAAGQDIWLVFAMATAIVINGVSLARIYTKVCMGSPVERLKSEFTHSA